MTPFGSRRVLDVMRRLPASFKREQRLAETIYDRCWPELLDVPIQSFSGLRGFVDDLAGAKRAIDRALGRRKAPRA
jgi:hypothetical protein